MDAFEQLVSEILWMEGYWVRTTVKVPQAYVRPGLRKSGFGRCRQTALARQGRMTADQRSLAAWA
jgi:hypothetical protein